MKIVGVLPRVHFYAPLTFNRVVQNHSNHEFHLYATPKLNHGTKGFNKVLSILKNEGLWYILAQGTLRVSYAALNFFERFWKDLPEREFLEVTDLSQWKNIEYTSVSSVKSEKFQNHFRTLNPDLLLSVFFNELIPEKFIETPNLGAFNLHPGRLPEYRGFSPVFWQLFDQQNLAVSTLHQLTPELDAGPIVDRTSVKIEDNDTYFSLYRKLAEKGATLIDDLIKKIEMGQLNPEEFTPQSRDSEPYRRFTRSDVKKFYCRGNRFWRPTDFVD